MRFTYDFADLIEGKNFYWVEAMTGYNPTACRILITSEDRSASLPTYDPNRGDGPWWRTTLEFARSHEWTSSSTKASIAPCIGLDGSVPDGEGEIEGAIFLFLPCFPYPELLE